MRHSIHHILQGKLCASGKSRWTKQKPPIALKSFLKKYLGLEPNMKGTSERESQAWILDGFPKSRGCKSGSCAPSEISIWSDSPVEAAQFAQTSTTYFDKSKSQININLGIQRFAKINPCLSNGSTNFIFCFYPPIWDKLKSLIIEWLFSQ